MKKSTIEAVWQRICNRFIPIDPRGKIPYVRNRFRIKGVNNKLFIIRGGIEKQIFSWNFKKYLKNLEVIMYGNDNTLRISLPVNFQNTKIVLQGNRNTIIIQNTKYKIQQSMIRAMKGASCIIGNNISVSRDLKLTVSGKGTICRIGNDCMLSGGIIIMNDDGHVMHDNDGNYLTKPGDIAIGDHVWLGLETVVLKGAIIPDNSVVALRAVVNKAFGEPNIILAGLPARVIKRNIKWKRDANL